VHSWSVPRVFDFSDLAESQSGQRFSSALHVANCLEVRSASFDVGFLGIRV